MTSIFDDIPAQLQKHEKKFKLSSLRSSAKMRADGNHLLFTHLTGGNHRATWYVAYGIKSVQDWLFEQQR